MPALSSPRYPLGWSFSYTAWYDLFAPVGKSTKEYTFEEAKDVIIKIPTLKDDSSTVNSLEKFTTLTLDSTSFSAYLESATIA